MQNHGVSEFGPWLAGNAHFSLRLENPRKQYESFKKSLAYSGDHRLKT